MEVPTAATMAQRSVSRSAGTMVSSRVDSRVELKVMMWEYMMAAQKVDE